jgi:hypothetical protein
MAPPRSPLARRRPSLSIVGLFALAVGAPAGATTIRYADQSLIWPNQEGHPLPESSHLGAVMALSTVGDNLLIGAPDGGAKAAFRFDPAEGWTPRSWWFSAPPQYIAMASDFPGVLATDLQEDFTTTVLEHVPGTLPQALLTGFSDLVTALAKSGDTLAVGQAALNGGAGRVRIYEKISNVWALVAQFQGAPGDGLGRALALQPGMLIAGAPGNGPGGAVHVYVDVGSWIELQEILCPGGQAAADFGAAVAISGSDLAVGAPRLDRLVAGGNNVVDIGGVFTYRPQGLLFTVDRLLRPSESAAGDRFGTSLALEPLREGGVALVAGAPREDAPWPDSGAAYLFLKWGESWRTHLRLLGPTQEQGQRLGTSVAIGEMGVLAGAPNRDANLTLDQGMVYAFHGVVPLFADGFQSGDTGAWSASTL